MPRTHETVPFRLIQTPCCGALLCWVNPRLPNFCPECGKGVYSEIRGCVLMADTTATLSTNVKPVAPLLPVEDILIGSGMTGHPPSEEFKRRVRQRVRRSKDDGTT